MNVTPNVPRKDEPLTSTVKILVLFAVVILLVFVEQSAPYCHSGLWLAGIHADGPFYFSCEALRLDPASFPDDLAVQSNQNLGAYEYLFAFIVAFTKTTGLSLLNANLVLCWLGNFLYLAGVMFLLRRIGARPVWAAIGTFLIAQPFVLIGMSSGVIHSLTIPREVSQWPLPWLVAWFLFGRRERYHLLLFYGAIGAVFSCTYPLWAVLLGLGFGLADAVRFWGEKDGRGILWLGAAGLLCMALVAIPSLATYHAMATGGGAILDYNQITRSVYLSKGFRRLLLFVAAGWGSFWILPRARGELNEPLRRLQMLLLVSLGVCLICELPQRLFPVLSLLYLGRLSLVAYLVSMMAVVLALDASFRKFPVWGKTLAVAAIFGICLFPVLNLFEKAGDDPSDSIPAQKDFFVFCQQVRQKIPADTLTIIPPLTGAHYFRVYAERSLWISNKDIGVLSRSRSLYDEGTRRLKITEEFYDDETSPARRETLLQTLKAAGVNYAVVNTDEKWIGTLSWPIVCQNGKWQLRSTSMNSEHR